MTDTEPCIRCSHPSGYNRLVIDAAVDRIDGGFCRTCELELFGETLSTVRFEDDSCVLCERDGFYLLAPWLPEAREEADGSVTVTGEFYRDGPRLCDFHHHEVADPALGGFDPQRQSPRADHTN